LDSKAGSRFTIPLCAALGLAVFGQALFLLASAGELRAVPIAVVAAIALVVSCRLSVVGGRQPTTDNRQLFLVGTAFFTLLLLLALHPPTAFDETLYHLPFVRALAASGRLQLLPDMRFLVFPQLQELLAVPLYLMGGGVATHMVSLVEVLITAALLLDWGRRYGASTGPLAAAFFLGSPIVVQLATVTYVDAALTLFVTAGFYCLDREEPALSGIFFGTACSVKYLGGYFAAAALLVILVSRNRRAIATFIASCVAAALPTTLWLTLTTHNPVFPFLRSTIWSIPLPSITLQARVIRLLRVLWDVSFARDRVGFEPPVTPLLIAAAALLVTVSLRNVRARWVVAICGAYLIVFTFLPRDARYLVPLLPLIGIAAAATLVARWSKYAALLAWIAIAPGFLYAGYRLTRTGLPPVTAAGREAYLQERIPEYRAVVHAGTGTIYVCGGEQLKYYAKGRFLGDFYGPYSYDRVLGYAKDTASIADRLRRIDAEYFLVATRVCAPPQATGGMDLVYSDSGAQLWRVRGFRPQSKTFVPQVRADGSRGAATSRPSGPTRMSPLRGWTPKRFVFPALTRWANKMSPLRGCSRKQSPLAIERYVRARRILRCRGVYRRTPVPRLIDDLNEPRGSGAEGREPSSPIAPHPLRDRTDVERDDGSAGKPGLGQGERERFRDDRRKDDETDVMTRQHRRQRARAVVAMDDRVRNSTQRPKKIGVSSAEDVQITFDRTRDFGQEMRSLGTLHGACECNAAPRGDTALAAICRRDRRRSAARLDDLAGEVRQGEELTVLFQQETGWKDHPSRRFQ
jgi:hypothetical protein